MGECFYCARRTCKCGEPPKRDRGRTPVPVCTACLDAAGGECHTAGCIFWLMTAPDLNLRERLEMYGIAFREVEES